MDALVAIGGIAHMNKTPINTRQATIWVIPGLTPEKERLMRRIEKALTG